MTIDDEAKSAKQTTVDRGPVDRSLWGVGRVCTTRKTILLVLLTVVSPSKDNRRRAVY